MSLRETFPAPDDGVCDPSLFQHIDYDLDFAGILEAVRDQDWGTGENALGNGRLAFNPIAETCLPALTLR